MTNLYIYTYQHDYIFSWFLYSNEIGNSISSHFQIHGDARVCFSNNRKDTPSLLFPVCPCEIREYLRVPPLFTSSSRWNERIHPSLPHSSMRTRERFLLSTVIYTRWSCRKSSFRRIPPEGGCSTVVQISRFIFFSLFPSSPLVFVCRENSRITAIVENVISEWRWFKRIFDGFYKLVKLAPSNLFSLPLRTVFNRKFISPVLEGGRFTVLN